MRVLFVANSAWPAVGGAEMLIRHVATGLAKNHDVTVLALRIDDNPSTRLSTGLALPPPFDPFADGRVKYVPLRLSRRRRAALLPLGMQVVPVARRYAYGSARKAAAALYASVVAPAITEVATDPDIIHTWTADLLAAAGVRAAKLTGARSVITPFLHVGQWGSDPASVRAYRAADCVIGLLESERESLVDLGVPAARVGVCGTCSPGVDRGGGADLRAAKGINGPLVLFVGVRRPYKGFDLLLAASPRVTRGLPNVTFAFVGPGEPVGVPDGVHVVDAGQASPTELADWLDAADVLCLPSAHEIFPMSVLEAWSVETPVLVSDLPPLRELMGRSGGGVVVERRPVELADALLSLLNDPDALREHGKRGKEFWQAHHTPSAVAECYARRYASLLGVRSGERSPSRTSPRMYG